VTLGNAGPILGLAHTTLAVENLDTAVAAYKVLFAQPCTRRGTAEGFDSACFAVTNTALVLVAPHGELPPFEMHVANRPAGTRASLGALGFAVAELESATRLLQRRGLPTAGPMLPWRGGLSVPLAPARRLPAACTSCC
jgi:hypothetical protein